MDIDIRINALVDYYCNGDNAEFANKIGISPSTLSSWKKRQSMDFEKVFAKCEGLNGGWLLSGKGEMLIADFVKPITRMRIDESDYGPDQKLFELADEKKSSQKEDGKTVEELLAVVMQHQKIIDSSLATISQKVGIKNKMHADGYQLPDVKSQAAKLRAQTAAGEIGHRNMEKQKAPSKKN